MKEPIGHVSKELTWEEMSEEAKGLVKEMVKEEMEDGRAKFIASLLKRIRRRLGLSTLTPGGLNVIDRAIKEVFNEGKEI